MSVELISVLIAVLAVGATLGGLILTGNRGLMRWSISSANCASAWRIWKDCWKDCARPLPDGSRPANLRRWGAQGNPG